MRFFETVSDRICSFPRLKRQTRSHHSPVLDLAAELCTTSAGSLVVGSLSYSSIKPDRCRLSHLYDARL